MDDAVDSDKKQISIKLNIQGCLEINDIQSRSKFLSLRYSKSDIKKINGDFWVNINMQSTNPEFKIEKFKGDLELMVLCDYNINRDQIASSNLVRSKIDPNYRAGQNKFEFLSSRVTNFSLRFVDMEYIEKGLEQKMLLRNMFYQRFANQVYMVPRVSFVAYVRDSLYLLFEYEAPTSKTRLYFVDSKGKSHKMSQNAEDFDWRIEHYHENFNVFRYCGIVGAKGFKGLTSLELLNWVQLFIYLFI